MGNFKSELKNYESVPRSLVFDKTLSDRARFVYVYMACKPEGWDFFLEPMAAELGYSIDTLRKYLNELALGGWLTKGQQTINANGQFSAVLYTLKAKKEIPTRKKPCTENTDTENFRDGKNQTQEKREDKEKQDIYINERKQDTNVSNEVESTLSPKKEDSVLDEIFSFFNEVMANKAIKPISRLTDKRKLWIKARLREYGLQDIKVMIQKAAASDFLNGQNNKNWMADFDWLFRPNNFPKVLEGNYDNRERQQYNNNGYGRETVTDKMRQTITEAEEFDRQLTAQREANVGNGDSKPIW